jgi:hypothetical protein
MVRMNDGKLLRRNTSHLKKSTAVVFKPQNRYGLTRTPSVTVTPSPACPSTPAPQAEPRTYQPIERRIESETDPVTGDVFTRLGRRVRAPERLDL